MSRSSLCSQNVSIFLFSVFFTLLKKNIKTLFYDFSPTHFLRVFWPPTEGEPVDCIYRTVRYDITENLSTFPNFHCLVHWARHYVGHGSVKIWKIIVIEAFLRKFTQCAKDEHTLFVVVPSTNVSPSDVAKCVWASRVLWHLRWAISHTRSVLSSEAVSRYFPPGCQVIPAARRCNEIQYRVSAAHPPRTQLSCPAMLNRHWPVLTSYTLIVLSRLPLARNGPLCETLQCRTSQWQVREHKSSLH